MSNAETYYINTFRYRAPPVVPLEDGRLAVLTPGWVADYVIHDTIEGVHRTLLEYVEWNVSEPVVSRTKKVVQKARVMDQIMDLIKDIK